MAQTLSVKGPPTTLRVAVVVLALAALLGVATAFTNASYDWDLDHEIYFGQRLLSGELIWTEGFHDKLPFTQIAFAIPASFENSLLAFRLLSLASVIGGAAALFLLLPGVIGMGAIPARSHRLTRAFGALLFVALSTLQIPGIMSMNPVAASFALIATLLVLTTLSRGDATMPRFLLAVALGSFAAAVSISLRPHFIAPLAVALLFAAYRDAARLPAWHVVAAGAVWIMATGLWGFVLNLAPYIVTGEGQAFRDGLSTLAYDIHDRSFLKSLAFAVLQPRAIVTVGAWVIILAMVVLHSGSFRKDRSMTLFMATLAASALALFGMFAATHFWAHYFNFFSGYLALATTISLIGGQGRATGTGATGSRTTATGHLALILAGGLLIWSLILLALDAGRPHDEGPDLAEVESYLAEKGLRNDELLAPTSMYLHWRLRSPIGVLPHAAGSQHTCFGWFETVTPVQSFPLPRTEAEYCTLLVRQTRPLIVEQVTEGQVPDCDWHTCLLANGYYLDRQSFLANGKFLRFYRIDG